MKYRVLHKGYELINENDLLDTLLKARGVENPKKLLNLDDSMIHNGLLFNNMDRGLNMLHWHIENNSKIHILTDVDTDGVTSMVELYRYIKKINKNIKITFSMNENKKHGIILKNLKEFDFDLLITPDSSTNDTNECKILKEKHDVDILILDHHDIENENPHAIVINCKDGCYPNNTLSGAGVVYKFIKEYDKKYNYNYADDDLDIVSIGIVGDSMDLRNYETRLLSLKGLKQIKNTFLKEFLMKNKIEEDKINFDFVGWKIAPYINAVTRVGTPEEKIDMLKAFLEFDETKEYQPRRKNKNDDKPPVEIQTIQKAMLRECTNIKSRQDKLVQKGMIILKEKIEQENLDKNKVIVVDGTGILEKSFTGLVANKIAEIYRRPVIILKKMKEDENGIIFGGSFRNYDLFPLESLKELLTSLDVFDSIGGHDNAGGFQIHNNSIQLLIDKLNNEFKDIKIEDVYLVDYEIPVARLKEKQIKQVGQWADIWGNSIRKPLFAITDIVVDIEDIQLKGDKRNIIRIDKAIGNNKITFIKHHANEELYNQMIMKQSKGLIKKSVNRVKLDIVGEFVLNKWNDYEFAQINIVDFNVSDVKEFRF